MSQTTNTSESQTARFERPIVLGIESSCDDTACAVLDGQGRVLSSVVSSQLAAHLEYGGVVPEIASREHLRNWPTVNQRALDIAGVTLDQIDAVAATRGPGLVGSLLVGLSVGKAIAFGLEAPFFGVHHLEGHLYSPFLVPSKKGEAEPIAASALAVPPRFIGLVVSGGHTALYDVQAGAKGRAAEVTTVCETRDDAMGECFDKVGKRLGLAFPGGPLVDQLAELGTLERGHARLRPGQGRQVEGRGRTDSAAGAEVSASQQATIFFRRPRCGDTLDFSYSGLKTQAIVEIERLERGGLAIDAEELERLRSFAASGADAEAVQHAVQASSQHDAVQLMAAFRDAAVRQVVDRLTRYYRQTPDAPSHLAVSGGVAANRALRRALLAWGEQHAVTVHLVPLAFCGDNAAMIAHAALRRLEQGETGDSFAVDARSRLPVR